MTARPFFRDFLKVIFSLTARVMVWSVAVVGLNALLSNYGASIGLTREVGLYIWAITALLLGTTLIGPLLARRIGRRKTIVLFSVLLIVSAIIYFVLWLKVEQIKQHREQTSHLYLHQNLANTQLLTHFY